MYSLWYENHRGDSQGHVEEPEGVRLADLAKERDEHFGPPRQTGGSHRVYRTPRPGDPRVNTKESRGMAKAYQVRQILKAIRKLQEHGY